MNIIDDIAADCEKQLKQWVKENWGNPILNPAVFFCLHCSKETHDKIQHVIDSGDFEELKKRLELVVNRMHYD